MIDRHGSAGGPPGALSRSAASARLQVRRLRPAYQQVADELRAQIVAGVITAGERLPSEAELCAMFGVSRSTVREALRVLVSQHLIETTRGVQGGSFVAAPDPVQVIADLAGAIGVLVMTPTLSVTDLLEARLLLEPAAARLAAERVGADTAEAVATAAGAARDVRDPSGFAPHIDFHTTVLMATRNPMLAVMLQPISDVLRTRLERARASDRAMWSSIDTCHLAISDAICAGDAGNAERLMRDHLADLRTLYEEIDTDPLN